MRNCKKHIISIIWHVRQKFDYVKIVAAAAGNEKRHMRFRVCVCVLRTTKLAKQQIVALGIGENEQKNICRKRKQFACILSEHREHLRISFMTFDSENIPLCQLRGGNTLKFCA